MKTVNFQIASKPDACHHGSIHLSMGVLTVAMLRKDYKVEGKARHTMENTETAVAMNLLIILLSSTIEKLE